MVEVITLEEMQARMKAQGVPRQHIALKCPICGTVQSMQSLIDAGASDGEAERQVGYACIGRLTGSGPHKPGEAPGRGCDWTLGGLFKLHELEVVVDSHREPFFAFATPEEAQALMAGQRLGGGA